MLKENAVLKQDFILKVTASNINIKIGIDDNEYFLIKLGSAMKDVKETIENIIPWLLLTNLEILYSTQKSLTNPEKEEPLLTIPKIVVKKNFTMSQSRLLVRPTSPEEAKNFPFSVKGFRLQDREFQELVINFYLLVSVYNLNVKLPFSIQPMM